MSMFDDFKSAFAGVNANSPAATLNNLLRDQSKNLNFSGFMPDKSTFDADFHAKLAEIMGQLPVGIENFNSDLASRGIFGSGEAPKNLYSNVFAPITRSAALAASQNALGFANASQQGAIAQQSAKMEFIRTLLSKVQGDQQLRAAQDASSNDLLGGLFGGVGSILGAVL